MNSVNTFSARLGLGGNSFCLTLLAISHYFNRPAQHGDTLLNSVTSCAHRQSHSITLTHNSTKTLTPRLTPAALGTISTSHSRLLFILLSVRNEAPEASRHPKLSITHTHTHTHLASSVKCNLIR